MRNGLLAGFVAVALVSVAGAAGIESTDVAAVPAGTYDLDGSHTSIGAAVSHLGFTQTTVNFDTLSGKLTYDPGRPDASSVDVKIDAASLDSGWTARDNHLKSPEFFNVAQFPEASFFASKLAPTGANRAQLLGELTLLGVTKPVIVDVTFNGLGKGFDPATRIGFSGAAKIKRSDFGMKTFLPAVGDDVAISIQAEFVKVP